MAYFSLEMEEVNFPLMTLVDYRGFRLVAISVLPVGKGVISNTTHTHFPLKHHNPFSSHYFTGTLIYGTCDGGATYFNSNKAFSDTMHEAAGKLNLEDHFCGSSYRNAVKLSAAADIEGHRFISLFPLPLPPSLLLSPFCLSHSSHRGFDGKFYLLDFSRTMPPVMPKPDKYYNGHLFYLFRREFVRTNPKPLCSDAYSVCLFFVSPNTCPFLFPLLSHPAIPRDLSQGIERRNIIILQLMKPPSNCTSKLSLSMLVVFIRLKPLSLSLSFYHSHSHSHSHSHYPSSSPIVGWSNITPLPFPLFSLSSWLPRV